MTTTNSASAFDYNGVQEFKENLSENLDFIDSNLAAVKEYRNSFIASVLEFYRTKEYLTDKQINALLPVWRELQESEGFVSIERRELDGKPKFR